MVSIRPSRRRGPKLILTAASLLAACGGCGDLARGDDSRLPAGETRSLQEQFEKRQSSLRTAAVDFSQTLSLAGLRNPAVSRGRILYASPGRLLIEYQKPAGDFVLLPGDGTLVTRRGRHAAVVQRLDRMDARTRRSLTLLLSLFEGKLPAGFGSTRIEARREGDNHVVFSMSPNEAEGAAVDGVDRVETTLQQPALDPIAINVRLTGGAEMRYDFGRIDRQAKLPADSFNTPSSP